MKTPAIITFRTKTKNLIESDGTKVPIIEYKRKLSRVDCNLRPHQHAYYNSDLFPGMLNRAYQIAIGNREWCRLSALPECVTVDTSGFLAEVTVRVDL